MSDKAQKKTAAERYGSAQEKEQPKISQEDKKLFKEWQTDYALAKERDAKKPRR